MENEKSIEALNTLIEINNDRIEGYETASKETEDGDLQSFFGELAQTSHKCQQELSHEVIKLGGTPTENTKTTGKFFRVWMDVKAALTGHNSKAILDSCEYGEDKAKDTYEDALEYDSEHLTTEQQAMLQAQHALLKADHDKVKARRDALEKAA
jgi:uncharacterized protein (TIGR02284 family)